ncbi:MAG: hypothetical protein AAGA54_04270 [Myxococcota bacterium]
MPVWRLDRIGHRLLPLTVALDAVDDAVVYVSLGGRVATVAEHAARHGARVEVERRSHTQPRAELLEYLA